MQVIGILTFVALTLGSVVSYRSYQNYVVVRAIPHTKQHMSYLIQRFETDASSFWSEPRLLKRPVDIQVHRHEYPLFSRELRLKGIHHFILHNDIDKLVQNTLRKTVSADEKRSSAHPMDWNSYHRLNDINAYVRHLAKTYPHLVTLKNLGNSFEGREMLLLVIENNKSKKPKRNIMIDGGIHAREWISSAVVSHLMKDFTEDYHKHADILDNYVIHIIPCINPDGYEYTHTDERAWRKTRSKYPGTKCVGTDPNRNFDFHWAELGTSNSPCSDIYAGPHAFSEIEMAHIGKYLNSTNGGILYLTFHSFGQLILYPWGYDAIPTEDTEDLAALADLAVQTIYETSKKKYTPGVSSILLYPAAGASDDYAKGVAGYKYSYTVELRDKFFYGFMLPPDQIMPTVVEIRAMTLAMFKKLLDQQ